MTLVLEHLVVFIGCRSSVVEGQWDGSHSLNWRTRSIASRTRSVGVPMEMRR